VSRLATFVEPLALVGWSLLLLIWLARRPGGKGVGRAAVALATAYFWVATPLGANVMMRALEGDPAAIRSCQWDESRGVIVALAGGVTGRHTAGPPVSRLKEASFRRTVAAAELTLAHSDARLILSGGAGWPDSEAELMRALALSFGVPSDQVLTEARSRDTGESAALVAAMLRGLGTSRIHLVTSALHMRRAAPSFEAQGIRVCRHPVDWRQVPVDPLHALLPQISAMEKSTDAVREMMGGLWYRLSGKLRRRSRP
jgi:uncharacterized SAM-binding protein YcdF (DUF218 family)